MVGTEYIAQPSAGETAVKYADDVLNGTIVAGKYVKLACKRFLSDLESGESRGFYFDEEAAQHAIDFFGFLRHTKGVWAKKAETAGFLLSPWEVFVLANLFGWRRLDNGFRRYREAHIEVARKNGKSTFIAGIGLYMLFADGEPGADVYSAACTKDQARIVFKAAQDMVKVSSFLNSRIGSYRLNLHVDASSSKFEPLASDSNTLDGLNIHCALIDELHEHPDRSLYDVLNTGTGSRAQPLILAITTAGHERTDASVCWTQRTFAIKILLGIIPDDDFKAGVDNPGFFSFIATLDEGDDPWDEKNWPKANPNIGISVSYEALRPNAVKAKEDPLARNEFLRKHLNVWTDQDTAWLAEGAWAKNCSAGEHANPVQLRAAALEKLKGRRCFGGLDLSECEDIAAYSMVFPPCEELKEKKKQPDPKDPKKEVEVEVVTREADPKWHVLTWFWIPEAFVEEKAKKGRAPYEVWIREGFITRTPGHSVSQEEIRNTILSVAAPFRLGEVGFDKWGAEWIGPKLLADGIKMVQIPQRFEFLSAPTKQLTALINAGMVEHYNNPVLRWMASNVQLLVDSNGNCRPDKGASKYKIDGIVAAVMGCGRALANPIAKGADAADRYRIRYI